MSQVWRFSLLALFVAACSSSDEPDAPESESENASAGSGGSEMSDALPLRGSGGSPSAAGSAGASATGGMDGDPASAVDPAFVRFVDPDSGLETHEVHDADREVVFFDAERQAMVWAASGDAVTTWTTSGADLGWDRSGVAFRVRFGTEDGQRRAYFTEAGPGTICDLTITGAEALSIRATSERPPQP